VTGTGAVTPKPANRTSNASIAAAVEKAEQAATPLAIGDGQVRAKRLADLSGMTLGPLLAIAETQAVPYGIIVPFGGIGPFGPARFCGTVRTPPRRSRASASASASARGACAGCRRGSRPA
jgi:hypothetical protein